MELELDEKFIPLFYLERDDDGELRKKIRVQFSSYSEYRKFENFVYSEKSRQDALKKLRLEGDLINSLQKDIDEYRKKTNVELKAMKEKIEAEQERVLKKLQEQSQLWKLQENILGQERHRTGFSDGNTEGKNPIIYTGGPYLPTQSAPRENAAFTARRYNTGRKQF